MSKADKKRRGIVGKQTRSGGKSPATGTPNEQAQGKGQAGGKDSSANLPKLNKSDVGGKRGGQLH